MQARKVARVLAELRDDMRAHAKIPFGRPEADWIAQLDKCFLLLALPKRKVRVKDLARAARRTTVKELDQLCRAIVFARDGNKCRRCGKTSGLLDWAHVLSRRHPKTRHDLRNSLVLCRACHRLFHDLAVDAAAMIEGLVGASTYAILKANSTGPGRADNTTTRLYLEAEAKRLGVEL